MSVVLPTVSLAGATPGNHGDVAWGGVGGVSVQASVEQYHQYGNGSVQLFNESGCGLTVQLDQSGDQVFLPAGGWRTLTLGPYDVSFTWTVLYVIANAPVTSLIVVYYLPGEQIDDAGQLGNSPIGLSGSVPVSVTQVIQDGQASGLVIVEATPTGGVQKVLITTDGMETLAGTYASTVGTGSAPFAWTGAAGTHNVAVFDSAPSDVGQINWCLLYNGVSHTWAMYNITSAIKAIEFAATGAVVTLAGQAAVGLLGMGVVVARQVSFPVSATTLQTVLSYAVTTSGLYRISVYILVNNGTSGQLLSAVVTWTDTDLGVGKSAQLAAWSGGGPPEVNAFHGAFSWVNSGYPAFPLLVNAQTGTNITVTYQDPGGTPADKISVIIERLN